MKRGELWTMAGGPGLAGKPRPALIVQGDAYLDTLSVTICPVTSMDAATSVMRLDVLPETGNGLRQESRVMIDKVMTLPRGRLGKRIGALAVDDMARVDRALLIFLGLAG